MDEKPMLGWDLARGADGGAELAGTQPPARAVLFTPAVATGYILEGPYTTQVDIWGLDPKLTVAPTFFHQLVKGTPAENTDPKSNLAVAIEAWAITKGDNPSEGVIELYQLDPSDLFANGGVVPDGCELSTPMTGIRFKLTATVGGTQFVDHEIVMTLVALTNAALHCRELALAALARLHVTIPPVVVMLSGGE